MHLLVSVIMENFRAMRAALRQHRSDDTSHVGSKAKPPPAIIEAMRGRLLLIDWDAQTIECTLPLHSPMGFCAATAPASDDPDSDPVDASDGWFVVSGWMPCIYVLDRLGRPSRRIEHRLFNNLHSIAPSTAPDRYLVTSTGIDAIFEIDGAGRVHWQWWAYDHGYTYTPSGNHRPIDRDADHRPIEYPTLERTAHPNAAIADGPEHILATLFHPGHLVRIHRSTGQTEVLRDTLDHPHDVRRLDDDTLSLADSRNSRILRLTATGETLTEIRPRTGEPLDWVQGALITGDGRIIASDDLTIGEADIDVTRGNRLIELTAEGDPLRELRVGPDWRLDHAALVDAATVARLRAAWPEPDAYDLPHDATWLTLGHRHW